MNQLPSIAQPEWYDELFVVHLYGCVLDESRRAYLGRVAEAVLRVITTRSHRKVVVLLCGGEIDPGLPGVTEAGVAADFLASLGVPRSLMRLVLTTSGVEHIRAVTNWVRTAQVKYPDCGVGFTVATIYYDCDRWAVQRGYRSSLSFLHDSQYRFEPIRLTHSSTGRRVVLFAANAKMLTALHFSWLDRLSQCFIQWARRRGWRLVR